jgi:hypothetical protein
MTALAVLNVGSGDTKLTFDKSKPEECKRACAAVTDMLKRGFAILVEVGEKDGRPLYQRAEAFDPETAEYIIIGAPDEEATAAEAKEPAAFTPPTRGRGKARRFDAAKTPAISVARSAGG